MHIFPAIAMLTASALLFSACSVPKENATAEPEPSQVVSDVSGDISDDDESEVPPAKNMRVKDIRGNELDLKSAFSLLYGVEDKRVYKKSDAETMIEVPQRLLALGDQIVLITAVTMQDGCHGCSGALSLYYFGHGRHGFEVRSRHEEAISGSSWGVPPIDWSVSDRFLRQPVLMAHGGGTWQGYLCGIFTLYRLDDSGPVEMVSVADEFSNAGAVASDDPNMEGISGKIGAIVKGKSFEVNYSGSKEFTDKYLYKNDKYQLVGKSKMPEC